ncbi:MAG: DUF885 domain-containing protein [Candidatus Obscuribacterales bacterium]|nr:DUF885 domain-containing protein [Candidatus Obscuribacterales bacterium]
MSKGSIVLTKLSKKSRQSLAIATSALLAIGFSTGLVVNAHSSATAAHESNPKNIDDLNLYTLCDFYFNDILAISPTWSTNLGFHKLDGELEDYSKEAMEKENALNKKYLEKFEALDASDYSLVAKDDLELLKNRIRAHILDFEVIQKWKKDPDLYSSAISSSLFPLIKRDFAPINERLASVISRENKMPEALKAAKRNIDRNAVPRIFAEVAEEQLPGIIDFFKNDVPKGIEPATDAKLKSEFAVSNAKVIDALVDYKKFVHELLADKEACKGSFALGSDTYAKKILYDEMATESLDVLLKRGQNELSRLQAEFTKTAHEIDPTKEPGEIFQSIAKDHPPASKLITATKDVLERLRTYCIEKHIIKIPSDDRATVEATPPFMMALIFAAMDTPGTFETKAKEAFYFVTEPSKDWTKEHTEEHMRFYSYDDVLNTSVHECYPGHYVQYLFLKGLTSKVRKILDCASNSEGWAHYCEQMMLDEGFGNGDKKLRLVQLHDALLRACRYICAIKLHTQGMTVAEATDFFVKEGYQEKANGEREAKRGTMDPTYLVYTLGKLQILSLREEVKKAQGDKFNLYDFHNRFLSAGGPPVEIVRREMMAELKH